LIEPKISQKVHNLLTNSRLGILLSNVKVEPSTANYTAYLSQNQETLIKALESKRETEYAVIRETRSAYKVCGKEPSRYRPSAEALLRRLRTKKSLYQINNVVDTINLISINTQFSIGGFDYKNIKGEIICDIGTSDTYEAIGRGNLNIEFMPGLRDTKGFFGTPTSDSVRTMVTDNTTTLLLVFYDFYSNSSLEDAMAYGEQMLIENCYGQTIQKLIISA